MILQFKGFKIHSPKKTKISLWKISHESLLISFHMVQLFLNWVNMACYFWFSTSAWSTVQNWRECASSTLKKYKVSQRFELNFNSVFLIFLMIKKRLGLQIKPKIEKLSWGHLDICLNSKIEEFFHMSKKICTSLPAIKVESKSLGHPVVVQPEPFLISPT